MVVCTCGIETEVDVGVLPQFQEIYTFSVTSFEKFKSEILQYSVIHRKKIC